VAVAFDAVGSSTGFATATPSTTPWLTWTHTAGTGGSTVIVGLAWGSTAFPPTITSITYGGAAMTSLGSIAANNSSGNGGVLLYGITGGANGANTVLVKTSANPTDVMVGNSMSFTGASQFGTAVTNSGLSTSATVTVTGTTSGNVVASVECHGTNAAVTYTAGTKQFDDEVDAATGASNLSGGTIAAGGSVTITDTISSDTWGCIGVEVQAAVSGVTFVPPRAVQPAPASPAPWLQRDRRDANTTGTPANPLPSPLDTAWQADAAYHHLYNDSHLRDRRAYFYQRPYVSDPSLLAPAGNADPLALNPEQSDSSDLWRVAIVPAFYDRREVPQQRTYYDTTLLSTAQLENELLGGAGTAQRYGFAAYCDRREVPQQPPRLADPLLIATAELENELLGGAATWLHYVTAAYYDRREVPQQRLYISDPSAYPPQNNIDPLLAGQDYLNGHQHQAATHYDRREVPQQRLYISDPSFYPTQAPTDPLTVAWGDGGNYWHLYNRAADITDRREVPQQRLYVSPPGLLSTAQLENELLGGAGTAQRYGFAAYCDRREVPGQRPAVVLLVPPVPLDPVLAAWADLWRRYATPATHYDRREVPQQRLYFPLPAPPPPFTVGLLTAGDASFAVLTAATAAGGAGGVLTASDTRTGGPA
jgi:hypothetical protein